MTCLTDDHNAVMRDSRQSDQFRKTGLHWSGRHCGRLLFCAALPSGRYFVEIGIPFRRSKKSSFLIVIPLLFERIVSALVQYTYQI